MTLNPETAQLTPRTVTQITQIVAIVKDHAVRFWNKTNEEANEIKLSKIDVSVDLKGSFLPSKIDLAQ